MCTPYVFSQVRIPNSQGPLNVGVRRNIVRAGIVLDKNVGVGLIEFPRKRHISYQKIMEGVGEFSVEPLFS